MKLPAYLSISRHGIFYFRWPVPNPPSRSQRRTVRVSLGTRCPKEAGALARYLAFCGSSIEQGLPVAGMDYSVIRDSVRKYFGSRLENAKAWRERYGPLSTENKAGIKQDLSLLEQGNRDYWHLLGSDHARDELDKFFGQTGLPRDECRDQTPVILDEIRKGQIAYWKALLAHSEALDTYDFTEPRSGPLNAPEHSPAPSSGPTLSEAVEAFFREHEKTADWTSGTVEKRRAVLDVALEWFGPDMAMANIGKREAASLKEATLALPANRAKVSRLRGLSLREAIEVPGIPKISNATANAYLSAYKVFWAWAEAHGFAPEALFSGMSVGKKGQGTKDRKPFTQEALEMVYSALTDPSSKFSGKTTHRWATLIAMFSGARLNEVCQLHVNDIMQEDRVWVFSFTEDGDATKRLKSSAARRRVPVHSRLIELGLLDYRDRQRELGRDRLFPDYRYHPKHGYGEKLSKWFNRTFTQSLVT